MNTISNLFVSGKRKVRFEATCCVYELSNLPYVSGLYYAKWKLKQGGSARGITQR